LNKFIKKNIKVASFKEVKDWLSKNNFKIEKCYSYGFIPHKKNISLLPYKIWYNLEKNLISEKSTKGSHFIIICKKMNKK